MARSFAARTEFEETQTPRFGRGVFLGGTVLNDIRQKLKWFTVHTAHPCCPSNKHSGTLASLNSHEGKIKKRKPWCLLWEIVLARLLCIAGAVEMRISPINGKVWVHRGFMSARLKVLYFQTSTPAQRTGLIISFSESVQSQ